MNAWKTIFIIAMSLTTFGCKNINGEYLGGLIHVTNLNAEKKPASNPDGAINFNWKNMLPAYMHFDREFNSSKYVDRYISAFYPNVWNKVKNDEFEINKARNKFAVELNDLREDFNKSNIFVTKVRVHVEKYDFSNRRFPISKGSQEQPDFSLDELSILTNLPSAAGHILERTAPFPYRFKVSFIKQKNNLPLSYIPISPTDAEKFIKSRKRQNGFVDRSVFAIIKFQIIDLKSAGDSKLNPAEFTAVIKSVFYEM